MRDQKCEEKKTEEESKEEKKKRKKKEEKSKRYGFLWVFMDYLGYLYRFLWICKEKSNHKPIFDEFGSKRTLQRLFGSLQRLRALIDGHCHVQ